MAVLRTDWAATKEAIRAWVETLSGVTAYYRDDSIPQHDFSEPIALLHVAAVEEFGVQTVEFERLEVSGVAFAVPRASRLLRVSLDVSVRAGVQIPGQQAEEVLTYAQIRAQVEEVSSDLPATVALNSAGPITVVPYDQDGWGLSQATSTWILSVRDEWQDTDVRVETIGDIAGAPDGPLLAATAFTHVTVSGA